MFKIIKRESGWWHIFNSNSKEVNISDFEAVIDNVAQTFIIQNLNGANVPKLAVNITDIIVIDETDGSVEETFADVEALKVRLTALGYTPYLGAGNADSITGLIQEGTNVTITGSGTLADPYIISASGGSSTTPTLQEVTDEGNLTTVPFGCVDDLDAPTKAVGLNADGISFEKDLLTTPVNVFINIDDVTESVIFKLPNKTGDETFAMLSDITGGGGYTVVSANQTAVNDTNYTVVANATFTDPSPTEGKGYVVYVRNGTATIGGTGYGVGSLAFRVFHSGAWSTRVYIDQTQVGSATQTALDLKDVLPVIYEKHANVPTFGGTALNNLEGVAFTITGPTARSFADTSVYTRRQRLGLTVANTGNLAQARQLATYFNRNSKLDVIIGLGFAENCTNANVRAFAGVSTTTLFTNVEPTALLNCIGIAKLTTSNNLHLIHNDGSGTATAIDLGASFPSNTIETDFYVLHLKTNGSNIDYSLTRVNTGGVATGTLSTDLPNATNALNLGYYVVQSTGANTTTGIDFFGTNIIKS
jgi:hypothetical protein